MSKLVFTITDAGRQEIVNASNTGTDKVEISSVGIGSSYYETNSAQTTINDEIKKITTIGGTIVSPDTIHVSAKDDTQDEYVVYTVGLYTGKGTLFAVYSQNTAILQKTASTIMLLSNDITFKSLDTANITFGDVVFINPQASETIVGVSRFATDVEIAEGKNPLLSISAKRLKAELDKKANLNSPALIGLPTAPTAAAGNNSTQIANTSFVQAAIAALVASSPAALDTLNELAAALGNDPNFATTVMNALSGKQPLDTTLTNLSGKDTAGILQYLGLREAAKRDVGTGTNQIPDMSKWTSLKADYGWRLTPDGFLEQWGRGNYGNGDGDFVIPFPNRCVFVLISSDPNDTSYAEISQAFPISNSKFRVGCATAEGNNVNPANLTCNWFAKGW